VGCGRFCEDVVGGKDFLFDSLHKVWGELVVKVLCEQIGFDRWGIGGGCGNSAASFDITNSLEQLPGERALGNFKADFPGTSGWQPVIHIGEQGSQGEAHGSSS
jgi:hypothetical protein